MILITTNITTKLTNTPIIAASDEDIPPLDPGMKLVGLIVVSVGGGEGTMYKYKWSYSSKTNH